MSARKNIFKVVKLVPGSSKADGLGAGAVRQRLEERGKPERRRDRGGVGRRRRKGVHFVSAEKRFGGVLPISE
jgi:hypothetical protein